jgi:selenocysteine lyase/cysteine desulfurase
MQLDEYIARFAAEPGYLDFARVGPIGRTVQEEDAANLGLLSHARFGSLDVLGEQHDRLRRAVSALTGFAPQQVVFQPNTSQGLMHAMFGLTGGVALARSEFPSLPFAVERAVEALGVVTPHWIETDHGRVTPGGLLDLPASVVAVAVSLVDFRTGHLVDLEGIRQVIGDRLLIVDAIQGFGVVDAPFALADVVVSGGQKWCRAGWGTGFLALSDRAAERLTPVWSGFNASESGDDMPMDAVVPPARGAAAYQVSNPDPIAMARFAAALEEIAEVGVPALNARIAENVTRVIDLADEYAIPIASPRAESERAGLIVLAPAPEQLTVLVAALHNHGITATMRADHVRLSVHATTSEESFAMLRAAFLSFSTAITV